MKNILTLTILLFLLFSSTLFGEVNIYPPNLRAPLDGKQGQVTDVLLDWDAVTGGTLNITYELQLSTNADFTDATVFDRTNVTAMQMSDLAFGQTFYWRVKAFDEETPSEWSEVWSFKTTSTVRLKNQPGPSIDGMVFANPLVSWYKQTGLLTYELQIDTTFGFAPDNSGTETTINATFVDETGDKWAVGDDGLVLHYVDTQWLTVDVGTSENLNDVYFVNATDGYLVGDGGVVVHFDGTDWTTLDAGTTNDLNAISFVDAATGRVVGKGGIIIRYDAGTWTEETTDNTNDLFDVFTLDANNVWACGENKTIMHYDGSEWMSEIVGTKDYFSLWFLEENDGWVVGESGRIYHYDGNEWTKQESGTSKDLLSISFDENNIGYAVGEKLSTTGNMIIYNGEWAAMVSGFDNNLFGVYSAGSYTVYGGKDGFLASSSDGFNSPYVKSYPVPYDSGSFQLANLLFGKTFYYRMRAIHSTDTSAWSGPWSMKTYVSPELNRPTNGDSQTELSLLFKWDKYDGATDYVFQIAEDEGFNTSWTVPLDSNSVEFATPLFDHEYFWHVSALHPEDNSSWSETWTFTTLNTVTLDSPDNNEEDVNSCPKFIWDEIEGVPEYELVVDTDENFANPMTQIVSGNLYQCQQIMEKLTMYYWKVRGITGLDTSAWSETWSFETEGYIGVNENLSIQSVKVYPNPASDLFSVTINSLKGDAYQLSVTDMIGKVLMEKDIVCYPGENKFEVKLDKPETGVYLVNIKNEGVLVSKKLYIR
jgi:photosystem II stability/assembly factor-like uncharacterized protein